MVQRRCSTIGISYLDEDVIDRDEELVETLHKYVNMVEDILQRFKDLVEKEDS